MSATTSKRLTYWLADQVTQPLRDRAMLLHEKGYDVHFFNSLTGLLTQIGHQRAGIVMVSDDGDEKIVERAILTLMNMPEIQGARMVLVTSRPSSSIQQLAACGSFRDFIAADLDDRTFLSRFIYATAARPIDYAPPPVQMTTSSIAAVQFPARVTWISNSRIRIECRLKPPVGTALSLSGRIAEGMGVESLSLRVVGTERSHLLYRFSDAIVASWNVPEGNREQSARQLDQLRANDRGPRCRIFIAAQSAELRNEALSRFDDPRFEVSTALQKQAVMAEPKYFTPDLIIIEDVLCQEDGGARFIDMVQSLPPHTTVVVIGRGFDTRKHTGDYAGRQVLELTRLPRNLTQSVLSRYSQNKERLSRYHDAGAASITGDSPFSLAEVSVPARLSRMHPAAVGITMPFRPGLFGLARLESPALRKILGFHPWIKITGAHGDGPEESGFSHNVDAMLSGIGQIGTAQLAASLAAGFSEAMARFSAEVNQSKTRPAPGRESTSTADHPAVPAQVSAPAPAAQQAPAGSVPLRSVAAQVRPPLQPASGVQPATVVQPPPSFRKLAVGQDPASEPLKIAASGDIAPGREPSAAPAPSLSPQRLDTPDVGLKPIIMPYVEAAQELQTEVVRNVRQTVKTDTFRQIMIIAGIAGFTGALIWAISALVAPGWNRSGSKYSDQLKKFAPHLAEPPPSEEK